MDKPNWLIAVFAFRVMLFRWFLQISSKNLWGLSMYNLFLDIYRYVFWHQTFYSTPCPFSPKKQVWLPRYIVNTTESVHRKEQHASWINTIPQKISTVLTLETSKWEYTFATDVFTKLCALVSGTWVNETDSVVKDDQTYYILSLTIIYIYIRML